MLFDSFEAYDVQETRRISREEGKVEGRLEGKIEDRVEAIIELLEDIGDVPTLLREQIEAQTDLDVLKKWHKLAARCETIEEFQEKVTL